MDTNTPTYRADVTELLQYREFWEKNLQKIQEITKILENQLYRLEEKHAGFDEAYDDLISKINLLLSIYSHYDSIEGIDYLFKLKSMLEQYKNKSPETIDFSALFHMHSKVIELRDRSFDRFPELKHQDKEKKTTVPSPPDYSRLPFRWVTFERNRSWFIHPFDEYRVYNVINMEYAEQKTSHYFSVTFEGKSFEAVDLFSGDTGIPSSGLVLLVKEGNTRMGYFADTVGKKILSGKDVIGPRLKPSLHPHLSPGRVRLFGRYHIYINTGNHRPSPGSKGT